MLLLNHSKTAPPFLGDKRLEESVFFSCTYIYICSPPSPCVSQSAIYLYVPDLYMCSVRRVPNRYGSGAAIRTKKYPACVLLRFILCPRGAAPKHRPGCSNREKKTSVRLSLHLPPPGTSRLVSSQVASGMDALGRFRCVLFLFFVA